MTFQRETKTAATIKILQSLVSKMKPHTQIPSERTLSESLGVSRMTLRSALDKLQLNGVLYSIQGSGTFVSEKRILKRTHLTSFTEDMSSRGLTASTVVLKAEVVAAPQDVCEAWGYTPERVYRIFRVRLGDGTPMCVEEAFIESSVAPDLLSHDLSGSLYAQLRDRYGRGIEKATHTVLAVALDQNLAELMDEKVGAPALEFTQVGFDSGGRPVEFCVSTKRADVFSVSYSVSSDVIALGLILPLPLGESKAFKNDS